MISIQEAARIIREHTGVLPGERVPLLRALGRVASAPLSAAMSLPPFDNAAMDGFALRAEDAAQLERLPVRSEASAGGGAAGTLEPGTACRIMTGAPMPVGADTVLPFEQAEARDGMVIPQRAVKPGENVRLAGEDVRAGALMIEPGMLATPSRVALAAALGETHLSVHAQPRVAILTTGNELAEPGEPLAPGQIYNANAYALMALVAEAGGEPVRLAVARDDQEATRARLEEALACDVVISSGGVSMGDYDVVAAAIAELGTLHFHTVAQQPGKPFLFATARGTPLFGLPGNPVATMVTFEMYVRPFLRRMQGDTAPERPRVRVHALDAWHKKPGRHAFLRARVSDDGAGGHAFRLAGAQGSAHFSTMAAANAIVHVEAESQGFAPGDMLEATLLAPGRPLEATLLTTSGAR